MKKIYFSFLFAFTLLACNKEEISIDSHHNLFVGHTLSLDEGVFQIHFDEVIEDSRCPELMLCVWEGRAVIRIITSEKSGEKSYEFSSFSPVHIDTIFETPLGLINFEISSINPLLEAPLALDPNEYNIDFSIKK